MAWDVILQRETEANWARGPRPPALQLSFSPAEMRALKLLEDSTRAHVVEVIGWARSHGIPAKLYGQDVIYTPEMSEKFYHEGKSGIASGRLDWHQVGRAYHLIIINPATKKKDVAAYARVGAYVRSRGGDWLGDKTIMTPKGPMVDLAHYEYHPDWDLPEYRRLPLAQVEYQAAQKRAARYG